MQLHLKYPDYNPIVCLTSDMTLTQGHLSLFKVIQTKKDWTITFPLKMLIIPTLNNIDKVLRDLY